jgi:hypothetical protein
MANADVQVDISKLRQFNQSMPKVVARINTDLKSGALPRNAVSLDTGGIEFGQNVPGFTAAIVLANAYKAAVNTLFDGDLPKFAAALLVLGEAANTIGDLYNGAPNVDAQSADSVDRALKSAPIPTHVLGG